MVGKNSVPVEDRIMNGQVAPIVNYALACFLFSGATVFLTLAWKLYKGEI